MGFKLFSGSYNLKGNKSNGDLILELVLVLGALPVGVVIRFMGLIMDFLGLIEVKLYALLFLASSGCLANI